MPRKWFINIQSLDELRNLYKCLLIKYHPDNNPAKDTTEIMQEINAEYDSLVTQFQTSKDDFSSTFSHFHVEEELKRVLNELVTIGADLTIELVGTWIWISGNTFFVKNRLKELGFKWASQKQMWYWGMIKHRSSTQMEMSFIRAKYGSVIYQSGKEANPFLRAD